MLDLIAAGATYLFPGGRALKLVKNGINIINSTNLLILTKNITSIIVDYCIISLVKLAAHCVAAGLLIVALVVSLNIVTISSAIHVVTEIYENC